MVEKKQKDLNTYYNCIRSGIIFRCFICNEVLKKKEKLVLRPCTYSNIRFNHAVHAKCAERQK